MEGLIKLTSGILFLGLMLSPVLIPMKLDKHDNKSKSLFYFFLCFVVTLVLIFVFAWWSYFSVDLLLEEYGYDFNGMNDSEKLAKVSNENIKEVEMLKKSRTGLGWPLRAYMTYRFYFPYFLIMYSVVYFVTFYKKKRQSTNL